MTPPPAAAYGRPGPLALWSSASIPGRPTLLVVDASGNHLGWEESFIHRIFSTMQRRGLLLWTREVLRVRRPEELATHLQPEEAFNCLLLFGHGPALGGAMMAPVGAYWTWLNTHRWHTGKLFALCTWEQYDRKTSEAILGAPESFAPLAVAPLSPLSVREAGLYFLKFFAELDLHTSDSVTGKMVWFSASKARELLRRRKLTGNVGVRC